MKYIGLLTLALTAFLSGWLLTNPGTLTETGSRPPIIQFSGETEPDNIYFDPAARILPRSWRPFITEVTPAERAAETAEDASCREVLTTSEQADIAGEDIDQTEVSIAMAGDTVVVTFNDGNEGGSSNSVSGYSVSSDGGKSFTDRGAIIAPSSYFGGGDPVIAVDPFDENHFIYLQLTYNVQLNPDSYSPSSIVLHHSYDGGQTFLEENAVDILQGKTHPDKPNEPAVSARGFHDKEWMSWDPINNNIVISWSYFYDSLDGSYIAFPAVIVSHDGGYTFDDPINPLDEGEWGGLVATASGPAGELYVLFNDFQTSRLLFTRSLDSGYTWEGPFSVSGIFQQPGYAQRCGYYMRMALHGSIRITSIPSMSVDPVTGEIYAVYNYMPETNNSDAQYTYDPTADYSSIAFVRSSDMGETWSDPITINDDDTTTDQFMPWVSSAGNGNVAVMFYDRRNDPSNLSTEVYLARSFDGGRTWIKNQPVTCTSFPTAANGGCYWGDYIQMVTDGSHYYLGWTDNRNLLNGQPNPDVYFTRVKAWPHRRPFDKP